MNKPDRPFHLINAETIQENKDKLFCFKFDFYLLSKVEMRFVFYLSFHLLLILSKTKKRGNQYNKIKVVFHVYERVVCF